MLQHYVLLGSQRTAKDLELQAAGLLLDNLAKLNHRLYMLFGQLRTVSGELQY